MSKIAASRIAPPNLRPAPASLTPAVTDRLVALADMLCATSSDPARQGAPRAQQIEGAYPYRSHRTVADWLEGGL